MTQDDVIRLATQARLPHDYETQEPVWLDRLETFAKLIAEHEREEIAQMIEDAPPLAEFARNHQGGCLMCGFTPKIAVSHIRARGQA